MQAVWGQGMLGRGAVARPRPTPSGRDFPCSFTDVAAPAGLTAPLINGGDRAKKYIVESTGTGVAFIDYANDGWPDIFLVNSSRFEGPTAGLTDRLYRNNRDGASPT